MLGLTLHYFSSLVKRLIILLLFCSFIPLILLALNYPTSIINPMMIDTIFISLPWLLWFHQAIFYGFIIPQTIPLQIFTLVMSTILSTIILMSSFPFTQRYLPLKINNILPNIVVPHGSIIPTEKGTLIIDPLSTPSKMFAQKNSKALWIDSNYIAFNSIKTNSSSFTLSKAYSFSIFGYYPQKGIQVIPFNKTYSSFPQYSLGQYILQTWFDNMNNLNSQITSLYNNCSIPINTITNTHFQQILQKKEPQSNKQKKAKLYKLNKTSPQQNKIKNNIIFNKIPYLFNYLNIALNILIIFILASFIGVFLTIKQNLLGASALLLIASLFLPSLSIQIITSQLQKILPSTSLLIINCLLVIILYICCFIAITMKKHIRKQQVKENPY